MEVERKPLHGGVEPTLEPVGPLQADVAERSYVVAPDEDDVFAHRPLSARSHQMSNRGRVASAQAEVRSERPALPTRYARAVLLLLAVASLASCAGGSHASAPKRTRAVVERVIDGDTIVLAGGRHVRLVQIDAPEVQEDECYGAESARVLRGLLRPGAHVRLETDPRLDRVDRFGRLLRYVVRRGRNVNLVLVRRGAATVWFYGGDRGRYAGRLLRAERTARRRRRGLWSACPQARFDPLHGADTGSR